MSKTYYAESGSYSNDRTITAYRSREMRDHAVDNYQTMVAVTRREAERIIADNNRRARDRAAGRGIDEDYGSHRLPNIDEDYEYYYRCNH